ncbi:ParM/StbA family protein [Bacillus cereus]|uniref:ParM/StbA family protein n=1 Tax=Bacillus cereus TaxID=1396 RepID=UPI003D17AA30
MEKGQLILDLGNSETRVVLRVGEIMNKTRIEHKFYLSNYFSAVYEGESGIPVSEDYTEENSTVFTLNSDFKIGTGVVGRDIYVNGLMCSNEFSGIQDKPTAMTMKYNSYYTVLTIITAIKQSAVWMKDYFAKKGKNFSVEQLINEVEWELTVLLPPSQEKAGGSVLAETLVGEITVKFNLPKADARIKISKVNVMAEGMMAYTGVLLSKSRRQPRPNKLFMQKSKIMVLDIGAGTTDLIVIDKGKAIERSKHTINLGGNNITQTLRTRVQNDLEIRLGASAFEEGVITGKVKQGITYHDITDALIGAKRTIAATISKEVKDYLEASNIEANSIEYILVVGGGSLPSENEKVLPISNYLLDSIRRFAPQVGIVDISDIITKPTSVAFENVDDSDFVSSRELNITGASTVADLREIALYMQQQKEKQAQA